MEREGNGGGHILTRRLVTLVLTKEFIQYLKNSHIFRFRWTNLYIYVNQFYDQL
jgi:hypothetical protein